MKLLLEFVRSRAGDDPHGLHFGEQEYLLRDQRGDYTAAKLVWSDALLADLAALRLSARAEQAQRVGDELRRFLRASTWPQMAAEIVRATEHGQPVELTVQSAAAELYLLPWELLTIKGTGQHLGELPGVLIRYAWPTCTAVGPASAPARVLFGWSAAGGNVPSASHQQALGGASPDVSIDVLPDMTTTRLRETLDRARAAGEPITALHVLCHGREHDGGFALAWNGTDSRPANVSPTQLRQVLAPHAAELCVVMLCACDTGDSGTPGSHLGSLVQALHRIGIPWVIGSRYPMSKRGSVAFAEVFYRRLLAEGDDVPTAFRAARVHLATLEEPGHDWMSVQLYACAETRAELATAHAQRLFLAYHRADRDDAEVLAHRLRERDIEPWLDSWNLIPGDSWQESIERALDGCATCAVLMGQSGVGPWQNEAMRAAIAERVEGNTLRVIPVLLPGARRAERSLLPPFLVNTAWVEFRRTIDDADGLHRLLAGVRRQEPGPGSAPELAQECPYLGLRAFQVEDAHRFFGREALTEWLLDDLRVSDSRFLAIVGASGSGKSSLAMAGLLPALRAGALPDSEHWPVVAMRPGHDPLESLAVALKKHPMVGDGIDSVVGFMNELADARQLHVATRLALYGRPDSWRVVVLVDQFEELFTLGQEKDGYQARSAAFVDSLLYASSIAGGQTVVLLTMRADFYGKCGAHAGLADALSERQRLVGPMSAVELRQAIERPALMSGATLEPGLAELLIRDMQAQAGALPLMQHALMQLWQAGVETGADGQMTIAAYRAMGGTEGALEQHAEATFAVFDADQQGACQRIALRLAHPGEGTEDTKRRAARAELGDDEVTAQVLGRLTDARLLTASDEHVEFSHEALLRGWSRLRGWLEKNREMLRIQHRLSAAVAEWAQQRARGDADDYLYRGARLAEIEEWCQQYEAALTAREREFVEASIAARDRLAAEQEKRRERELQMARDLAEAQRDAAAKLRRRLWLSAAIGVVTLVALVVAIWFYRQADRSKARLEKTNVTLVTTERESRRRLEKNYTVNAVTARDNERNPTVAAHYFARAADVATEPSKAANWRLAADDSNTVRLAAVVEHEAPVVGAAFSKDGARILTWSDDTARVWDSDTGRPVTAPLVHPDANKEVGPSWRRERSSIASASFAHDDQRIFTRVRFGAARLWNIETKKPEEFHGENLYGALITRDARQVVLLHRTATQVWDTRTGKLMSQPVSHGSGLAGAVFSPDERLLATWAYSSVQLWSPWVPNPVVQTLPVEGELSSVAFSNDGKRLLVSGRDHLWVWHLETEKLLTMKHEGATVRAVFNTDASKVLAWSQDYAQLWDASTGQPLTEQWTHGSWVRGAIFNADESEVLTWGGNDSTVRLRAASGGFRPVHFAVHKCHEAQRSAAN